MISRLWRLSPKFKFRSALPGSMQSAIMKRYNGSSAGPCLKNIRKRRDGSSSLPATRPASSAAPTLKRSILLLGLIREDKNLTNRFFPKANASIRQYSQRDRRARTVIREKVSTSVDLPFLRRKQAGPELLRPRNPIGSVTSTSAPNTCCWDCCGKTRSVAAEILRERGLRLSMVREELGRGASEKTTRQAVPREPLSLAEFSRDLTEAAAGRCPGSADRQRNGD